MRYSFTLSNAIALIMLLMGWLAASSVQSQIVAWQFGSPASTGDEASFNATTINANLSTSALTRGAGVNAAALARAFSATNFPVSGTKADAITNNRHFQFTVSAVAGYQVSLSTLNCRLRRTATGPNAYIWRYSTDGISFTDIGSDISFTSTVDGVDQAQIDLSGISALQNVASGTTITLRLHAWGATATTGTFAIGRYGASITTNSLAIGGAVSPISASTTVFFGGSNLTVNEDDGTANLTVGIADFSTTGSTSVDVVLNSGNAARVNGFSSQTVTWSPNDGADKTVTLTLTDDALCNGNETLTFGLTNLTGGQGTPSVASPSNRTVTVNDDEVAIDPVANAATGISNSGFTANWSTASGASNYLLDVSRYSDFLDPMATTLAEWNFPNNPDNNVVDGGIAANSSATLTTVGGTGAITYVPVASSTTSAATGGGWNGGSGSKYWMIEISTASHGDLTLSSKQRSSNTGPRDWQVEYRIGTGGTWTVVPGSSVNVQNNWTSGSVTSVALPAACSFQAQLFLRWIMTSNTDTQGNTVAAGGTSAIDDIVVMGRPESFIAGYSAFDAGSNASESITDLDALSTYYYRIRAAGGCASTAISNAVSVTTLAVPTYYSRATGSVNAPIWSDTPTGTAGPAVWSNESNMVVQSGDAVTIDASTTIKSLTVENGATLSIDAQRFLKATAGTNTILGSLNAADNSNLMFAEGISATLSISGTASFWDFTAGMTTGVTMTGNVEIRGTLQVDDGDLDCSGANVTLRSTAAYTGRLGELGSGASYTGNLRIERYIPAGATNWRLLGSPIANQQVVHWQDDFITAGYPGSQYPNFPGGAQPNWPSIRWYDETDPSIDVNIGLIGVTSHLQPLIPGQGFAAWCGDGLTTTDEFTIDLGGQAPVIGPVTLPMTWTDTSNPASDGWNLVANPLASPVDFESISRGADVDDYVTFFNPASGNTAVYDISLGFGTNDATSTIQSMQGFFLKASGPGITTVIDESDKIADNGGGMFGGSFGSVPPALRLRITSSMNTWKDEAGIVFHAGAPGLDAEDVLKYSLSATGAPRISTLAGAQQVAINAYGNLSTDMAIPVLVQAGASGMHTITVSAQGEFGISCITLEDLVTGTITSMVDGASYSFNLSMNASPDAPRFLIRASAPALLYAEDATCGGQPNGQATIVAQGGPHDITWMSSLGETLLVQNGIIEGVATITGLDAGSYSVSLSTAGCGILTRDFTINAPFVLEAQTFATNATCADSEDGRIDLLPLGGTAPYGFQWNDDAASTAASLIAPPGTYHVTITDANGCVWTSASLTIGHDGPLAAIIDAPATALVNEPLQFLAAAANANYFWSFGDGGSSQEPNPTHTYVLPGTYTVVLSVDDGTCADVTSTDITIELSTTLTETVVIHAHRAWITPQGIMVEHAFGPKAVVQVELLDATGRLAFERRIASERAVLPTDGLAAGLWFVRLSSGESRHTMRMPVSR